MKIPTKTIQKLIADYMGSSIFNGVHWFNYTKNESLDKLIEQIKQVVIGEGGKPEELLVNFYNEGGKTVIFNKNVIQVLSTNMFKTLEEKNKVKVKYTDLINIVKSKEEEIQYLVDYIKSLNETTIDIFLYKVDGPREKNIIITEGQDRYKMIVHGFYLTERDIEKVNLKLAEFDKKIYTLEKKELFDPFLGIRYTIQIGGADFVKE